MVTRQELQGTVDHARDRILEKMITKNDFQNLADNFRKRMQQDLREMHIENQQLIRQVTLQSEQFWRKTVALETRMMALEQEIKQLQNIVLRAAEGQSRSQLSILRPLLNRQQ
jgi:hypothetical protein